MIKRFIQYLIAVFIGVALLSSCKTQDAVAPSDVSATSQSPEAQADAKALLWKVSGNELAVASYVFGTIHMIEADDFFLPEGTLTAIDKSAKIVFEIDMADMNDPMKLMPMMQKAFMKGDTTLKDLMTEEEYGKVEAHFTKMGLPLFFLERIKPMFLTVFASGDFDPQQLQSGEIKSYEMEFASMAEGSNKETGGLETIDYQIGIFDGIPYKDQAQMLLDAISSDNPDGEEFQELINLYKEQDVEGLYKMMQGDETVAEYEDALLTTRNKNWIPIMSDMMSKDVTFFAVGAGHLGGPQGVINLLREEGYTLTPITE